MIFSPFGGNYMVEVIYDLNTATFSYSFKLSFFNIKVTKLLICTAPVFVSFELYYA